jgi:hypothetical protein
MMATTHELEAFCATCPSAQEVTTVLQRFGFRLTFQMDALTSPPSSATPALPAQFHYEDDQGTQVIYLAGHDTDPDGRWLPPHASRWWIFAGGYPMVAKQVAHVLTSTWPLTLRSPSPYTQVLQSA